MAPEFTNNEVEERYEVHQDGQLVGVAYYRIMDDNIAFIHTVTAPEVAGQGVGSQLARYALDDVRDNSTRRVLPLCPFIRGWITRHPEYKELTRRKTNTQVRL